jgi:hypothetical protein
MSSVRMAILKPSPAAPSRRGGMRQASKRSRASGCGAITSMRSAIEKPGVVGEDDEGGNAARARRLAGAGEDDVDVGDAAVGDPGLLAVEHIGVAVGGAAQAMARRRSRPRARRARRRRSHSPARDARQQRACCSSVPGRLIAPVPRPCMAKAKSASPSRIGERLAAGRARACRSLRSPPGAGGRPRVAQPAGLAQRAHQRRQAASTSAMIDVRRAPAPAAGVELFGRGGRGMAGSKNGQPRCVAASPGGRAEVAMSVALEPASLGGEGLVGAAEVLVAMQIAWAWASASMAGVDVIAHSWCSMVLVMPWAKVGPSAIERAQASAASAIRASARPGVEEAPALALVGGHERPV